MNDAGRLHFRVAGAAVLIAGQPVDPVLDRFEVGVRVAPGNDVHLSVGTPRRKKLWRTSSDCMISRTGLSLTK